jgi:dimethylargininase
MLKAIVRPPGVSFAQAVSSQQPRPTIDVALARQQHGEYCAALRTAGLDLLELPPDERHPDACFVQDTAVVFGDLAVVARFGVESREGEQEAVRTAFQGHKRLAEIRPPATLEGGDVLIIGPRLFVGLSERTNRAGFTQLRDLLELEGGSVAALPVPESLHLLSDCTYLGRGVLLAKESVASLPIFAGLDVILIPADEGYAANALGLDTYVILPAGYPHTAAQIRAREFTVLPVPLSEFAKADGGATCLSLPFRAFSL